jgi:putative SOS response-associated peptidase YedK
MVREYSHLFWWPKAPYIWLMCGRVRLSSDYSEIKIRLKFDLDAPAPNFEPDWNKPPTAPMLVAIRSVDGKRASRR